MDMETLRTIVEAVMPYIAVGLLGIIFIGFIGLGYSVYWEISNWLTERREKSITTSTHIYDIHSKNK